MRLDDLTDEQLEQREDALRTDIETKKNFVQDTLEYTNLFDFITYEMCGGDSDLTCEKLAKYFSDDYNSYCSNIIDSWFEDDED